MYRHDLSSLQCPALAFAPERLNICWLRVNVSHGTANSTFLLYSMYVYLYVYLCMCVYVCVSMYVYQCMCIHVCMYIWMYVHLNACMCIYVCVYICVYIYIYVCVYVYIYIYIHIYLYVIILFLSIMNGLSPRKVPLHTLLPQKYCLWKEVSHPTSLVVCTIKTHMWDCIPREWCDLL